MKKGTVARLSAKAVGTLRRPSIPDQKAAVGGGGGAARNGKGVDMDDKCQDCAKEDEFKGEIHPFLLMAAGLG